MSEKMCRKITQCWLVIMATAFLWQPGKTFFKLSVKLTSFGMTAVSSESSHEFALEKFTFYLEKTHTHAMLARYLLSL